MTKLNISKVNEYCDSLNTKIDGFLGIAYIILIEFDSPQSVLNRE